MTKIPLSQEGARSVALMQERILRRRNMLHDADKRHVCGYCRAAYRDSSGNVMCGYSGLGEGHVIDHPDEEGCREWSPRELSQPNIYKEKTMNERFAYKVRLIESLAAKGLNVNTSLV